MNFVADESVDAPVVHLLRENQYDIIYITEDYAGYSDKDVLELANKHKRILLTQDKDFGELVYRLKQIHSGVILLRLEGLKPEQKAKFVLNAIKHHDKELQNSFTIIQHRLIRIRK